MRRKKWRKKTHQNNQDTIPSYHSRKPSTLNEYNNSSHNSMNSIYIPYTLNLNNPLKYAHNIEDVQMKSIQDADGDDDGDGIEENSLRYFY